MSRDSRTDVWNTAHEDAYVKCKYLHRDISSGNILIRLVVRKTPEGYSVDWEGMLSDWELAKHAEMQVALQPQRTVCLPCYLRI